jgi:hypothetical protein
VNRYARVRALAGKLGLADRPATGRRLGDPYVVWAVTRAYTSLVAAARFMSGIQHHELFGMLDEADAWLDATGHRDWRAVVLLERARLHRRLGQAGAAVSVAEEALARYRRDVPGYSLAAYRIARGDTLRGAGQHIDAQTYYEAVVVDTSAGTTSYDRANAHAGLARCAVAAGDPGTARWHAEKAVKLAESLGDDALCSALDSLVVACHTDRDLDAAWRAATRQLEAARRVGDDFWPYYACRAAIDVAIDRCDLGTARTLLAELERHAVAMDKASGSIDYTTEAAGRRQRFSDREADLGELGEG